MWQRRTSSPLFAHSFISVLRFPVIRKDTIPVTPHLLYPQFMNDENQKERADAMHFNYVLLGKCNEMWVFGDVISKGMAHEIGIAKKRQQTVSVNIHSWKAVENWHWIIPVLKSM